MMVRGFGCFNAVGILLNIIVSSPLKRIGFLWNLK